MARPYVLLSCAMSLDGYIDDTRNGRLLLSNDSDFDRVDRVRAACDAILVGAATIRNDDPRLLVRSVVQRNSRVARGLPPSPTKVVITTSGLLDPTARVFADDGTEKIIYTSQQRAAALASVASIVDAAEPIDLLLVLGDLSSRGVTRLLVEGGTQTLTAFLIAGLADELHLAVAPFFVGGSGAPRFVADGAFPWGMEHPARLVEVGRIGDDSGGMALLRYGLSDLFDRTFFDDALRSDSIHSRQSTVDSVIDNDTVIR